MIYYHSTDICLRSVLPTASLSMILTEITFIGVLIFSGVNRGLSY